MSQQEHDVNNPENNSTIIFYDEYSKRQISAGINKRHWAILKGLKSMGLNKCSAVLEIGCGVGTLTQLISKINKRGLIHAVDISSKNIEHAKKRLCKAKHITFQVGDFIKAEIKGKYDVIVLPDVIEHIPISSHRALFQKISGLLNKKGFVLVNIPHPYLQEWNHQYHTEQLQIIDQAIYTRELLENTEDSDLYLWSLLTYSVWLKDFDYQQIVFKRRPDITENTFFQIIPHFGLIKRVYSSIKTRIQIKSPGFFC